MALSLRNTWFRVCFVLSYRIWEEIPILVKESGGESVGDGFFKDVPGRTVQGFDMFWEVQTIGMAGLRKGSQWQWGILLEI